MSKLYVNGESVSSSVNYASAVNCIDKDGNKSTVQAEIDKLHMNSKDYVALSPSAITDLTTREVGQWTIVPLKIDYQGSDEYSVTHNGGLNPTSQGMFAVSGQVWFEQCTASNMMQVSLWTWDNTNGDIQVTAPTLSVATTAGYATIVIPRVYLDFTGDKVLFLRVRNNNSATGAVPANWTTRLYVEKLYIESTSIITGDASDISCTDAEGNESNVQAEIDKNRDDISELNKNIDNKQNKFPFNIDWVFISGDFMNTIKPYCESGLSYFVIFQVGGSATNLGKVPIYSLGTLITNGIDRHCITVHCGSSGNTSHVTGFNNENTYSSDSWTWYGLNNSTI